MTVILNKDGYTDKAKQLLNEVTTYRLFDADPIKKTGKKLTKS